MNITEKTLLNDLSKIIEQGKNAVVSYANAALTLTFWQVGKRINEVVLKNKRADYGQKIVATMSEELSEKYGRGFEEKNLRRMLQFAQEFPTEQIVVPLARQLSWSHFTILLPIKNNDAKLFYANQSIAEKWSKRDLRQAISRKTFERAKIADTQLTANALIPQNTFKDPYLFDFLGLKNDYLENYLETAILREIESFILEFGKGFSRPNLNNMRNFYIKFPICQTLSDKLSWSHYVELIAIDNELERN